MTSKKMTKRDEESLKKKQYICDIALELFRKYGYEKTTIADISKESGISNGSIYHFFGSKNGILNYALRELSDITLPEEHWNRDDCLPYDIIMEFLLYSAQKWEEIGPEVAAHMTIPFLEEYFDAHGNYLISMRGLTDLIQYIQQCQKRKLFKTDISAYEAANYIMLVARSLVTDWCSYHKQIGLCDKIAFIMPRIIRSFLPDNETFFENN